MSWNRRFATLALTLALVAGVSCTSSEGALTDPSVGMTSQQPAQSLGSLGGLVGGLTGTVVNTLSGVTDLLTCSPRPYAVTTKTIGPEGGSIAVGKNLLVIPKKALSVKTRITAEQMPGSTNSVRFSPEGLHFAKSAELAIDYENCLAVPLPKKLVYTTEALSILELLKSKDYPKYDYVTGSIDHFSRYAVAY